MVHLKIENAKIKINNSSFGLFLMERLNFFNISVPVNDIFFSLGNQSTYPMDLYFRDDGTKLYVLDYDTNTIYSYTLSIPWDITTANYDNSSFTLGPEDSYFTAMFFKNDGTKLYTLGNDNKQIYSYTLSIPWEISSASYDGVNFYFGDEDTLVYSLYFKPDGTKIYIAGQDNSNIYSYTLSIPWDISTASYDGFGFSVISEDLFPEEIFFKPDGTKMYVIGDDNDRIYSYTLSTPWNISSASYDDESFFVGGQDWASFSFFFRNDGSRVYVLGSNQAQIFSYSLKNSWEISTASYNIENFYVGNEDKTPEEIFFRSDGLKMYILGSTTAKVYSYTLSTPWEVDTATYDGLEFYVGSEDSNPTSLFFKTDGTKMYILGSTNTRVYSYTLSNAWDISSATYDGLDFDVGSEESLPFGLFFKFDGTKMYITGDSEGIYSYSLSSSWDISTATFDGYGDSLYIENEDSTPRSIFFKPDGKKVYVVVFDAFNNIVASYTLGTPWNLGSGTYDNNIFYINTYNAFPTGVFLKNNGEKIYITDSANGSILHSSTIKPFELNFPFIIENSLDLLPFLGDYPIDLFFKPDGTKFYIITAFNKTIRSYTLSSPWNISTAIDDGTSYSITQDFLPTSIRFKPDGTKMYILGYNNRSIYSYTLSIPWNISTITYDNVSFSVDTEELQPTGMFFRPDGKKFYIVGRTSRKIHSYTLSSDWNISTATYDNVFLGIHDYGLADIYFNDSGNVIYVIQPDLIRRYELKNFWDLSSAKLKYVNAYGGDSVFVRPDGKRLYRIYKTIIYSHKLY
jgi:sugar lactone lactonase YvrE